LRLPAPAILGVIGCVRPGGSCCGRRDGHAGWGGLPHEFNLHRGQALGLIDEVAERALQAQNFGGEGEGGRAEKLKLGKQKAVIARRRARRSAGASCRRCALRLVAMNLSLGQTASRRNMTFSILLKNPSGQKVTVKKTISDVSPGNSNRVQTKLARKNSRHFSRIFTHLQKRGVLQQNHSHEPTPFRESWPVLRSSPAEGGKRESQGGGRGGQRLLRRDRRRAPSPPSEMKVVRAVALAGQADHLVTGNLSDFPAECRRECAVVSPA
jgi:hypothetical protein